MWAEDLAGAEGPRQVRLDDVVSSSVIWRLGSACLAAQLTEWTRPKADTQACSSFSSEARSVTSRARAACVVPGLDRPSSTTNLTGTFRACQVFGRHMIAERYGRIVNIGSLASFVGLHEVAALHRQQSGVAGLTRALAVDGAPHGVCVNAIAPGVFRTELNQKLLDGTDAAASCWPARR